MRDEVKKAPRFRFRGFQEDWELCKAEEFYNFKNGLNKEEEFFGSGVPIINSVDVFHNRGLTPEMLKGRVTLSKKEVKNFEVKQGDIFFTRTSETINEIGYPSIMLGVPTDTVFSGFVLRGRARSADPMDNLPKRYVFSTESFRNEMVKKSSMTTRALTSGTAIKEMYVRHPSSKDEQHKTGAFLAQIDDTIVLRQCELDQLKELKKTYLQLMFPVKNERVPKLRLADFEGEWKQCKFFDMRKKSSDRNKELKCSSRDVLSVAKMTKNPVGRNSSDEYMKTHNILHYGGTAFEENKSRNYSFGRFVLNNLQDGIASHVFVVFKPKVEMDIDLMKVYINNEYFMKHHLVKTTMKTLVMTTLDVQDMNKQKLRILSLNEQERIGKFFKELDHAITLHQDKLAQLKSLKRSYLQDMFI